MKKKIICIVLICIALLSVMSLATEKLETDEGDYELPREYLRDYDTMPISDNANETPYVSGDKYVINSETTNLSNESINGNVFAIVTPKLVIENVTINGNLFVMANTIEIKNSIITGSIFSMSQELITSELYTSDVYVLGTNISLDGTIEREAKIAGQMLNINCQINGNAYLGGSEITIGDNTEIFGTSNIEYSKTYNQSENAIVNQLNLTENKNAEDVQYDIKKEIKSEIANWAVELVKTFIIIGFVVLFTQRRFEEFSSQMTVKKFALLALKGLLWMIVVPIATIILIFVSRGYIFGIPIIILIVYGIIMYLSLQIVSIAIGSKIKEKYMKDKGNFELIGITLITMSVIWILKKMPYLGSVITLIVIITALGIMMKFIFNNKEKKTRENEEKVVELENK